MTSRLTLCCHFAPISVPSVKEHFSFAFLIKTRGIKRKGERLRDRRKCVNRDWLPWMTSQTERDCRHPLLKRSLLWPTREESPTNFFPNTIQSYLTLLTKGGSLRVVKLIPRTKRRGCRHSGSSHLLRRERGREWGSHGQIHFVFFLLPASLFLCGQDCCVTILLSLHSTRRSDFGEPGVNNPSPTSTSNLHWRWKKNCVRVCEWHQVL